MIMIRINEHEYLCDHVSPLKNACFSCYQIIALIQITVPVKSQLHSLRTMPNHPSCYILHGLNLNDDRAESSKMAMGHTLGF